MTTLRRFKRADSSQVFRRRATEGVATWLSRLPGGVRAYIPAPSTPWAVRDGADRLHALVRDRVTTNPVTRGPLSPVQVHLLELILEAVDWPALAVSDELMAAAESGDVAPNRPISVGPVPQRTEFR